MIKKISARNFISWERLDFEIESGVTLIEGFNFDDNNQEAAGKSSILNALCWGIYGRIPKDVNVDEVIREGAKSCSVTIELKDGTQIVRRRKPNDLYILKPGEETPTKGKDARETQEFIEKLIGLDFTTFLQSAYFAQNYPEKFITASPTDKSAILSKIQDLGIFDTARNKTLNKLKNISGKLGIAKNDIDHKQTLLDHFETEKDGVKALKAQFEQQKASSVNRLETRVAETKATIDQAQKEIDDYPNKETIQKSIGGLEEELEELNQVKVKIASEIENVEEKKGNKENLTRQTRQKEEKMSGFIQKIEETGVKISGLKSKEISADHPALVSRLKKIENFKNPKDKSCPTCGTVLEKLDAGHFHKHIEELGIEIEDIKKQYKLQNANLIEEHIAGNERNKTQMAELKIEIEELKGDLAKIEIKSVEEYQSDLKKINRLIQDKKVKKAEYSTLERKVVEKNHFADASKKVLAELVGELDLEQKKTTEHHDQKIGEIDKKIGAETSNLGKLKENYGSLQKHSDNLEILKGAFKEVKQYLFGNLLAELTRRTNRYLGEFFEIPVKIKFLVDTVGRGIPKINVRVTLDGKERSLGLYSGGQYRRIQLATDLALSDIVSSRGSGSLNLRIFDESMRDLSEASMKKVLEVLSGFKGSTLMIEHNSIFKTMVNNTVKVELIEGISRWV